jgi:hypothetical protein
MANATIALPRGQWTKVADDIAPDVALTLSVSVPVRITALAEGVPAEVPDSASASLCKHSLPAHGAFDATTVAEKWPALAAEAGVSIYLWPMAAYGTAAVSHG